MQEVDDESSEGEFVPKEEEAVEQETVEAPGDPPPLVRQPEKKAKTDLKEKVQCMSCKRWMSKHCLTYSHRCKARAPDEPPKEPAPKAEPKKKATFDRAALSKALKTSVVEKPLKDKALKESRSPLVLKVFTNYEMSFLVHSATESGRSIPTHWLEAIGLSTSDLMNARLMK